MINLGSTFSQCFGMPGSGFFMCFASFNPQNNPNKEVFKCVLLQKTICKFCHLLMFTAAIHHSGTSPRLVSIQSHS